MIWLAVIAIVLLMVYIPGPTVLAVICGVLLYFTWWFVLPIAPIAFLVFNSNKPILPSIFGEGKSDPLVLYSSTVGIGLLVLIGMFSAV